MTTYDSDFVLVIVNGDDSDCVHYDSACVSVFECVSYMLVIDCKCDCVNGIIFFGVCLYLFIILRISM